jgi:hypothetical protein
MNVNCKKLHQNRDYGIPKEQPKRQNLKCCRLVHGWLPSTPPAAAEVELKKMAEKYHIQVYTIIHIYL